jgi:Protein of unknown function (DUF1420)
MYGLDRFVASPPLSAILSVLLFAGCDGLGLIVLRAFHVAAGDGPRWQRWQAPLAGAMALAIVLYPLALANLTSLLFMRVVASAVAGIGILNVAVLGRRILARSREVPPRQTLRRMSGWHALFAITLIAAGLMSLGPVTDADSLDYHMGVPMALLRAGGVPVAPEWFHSRIAGSYEVLNALGLAIGSEAFGATLQFAGVIGITGLLFFAESAEGDEAQGRRTRTIATSAALSMPALVGLLSQKPQLAPAAMTSLALALVIYPSRRAISPAAALGGHGLVCLLVMSASQAKLPYLLGGGVVGLLSLGVMGRRGMLGGATVVSVVAAVLVLVPPMVWKHHVFHDGFINSLIRPVPGYLPGTEAFEKHLRTFRDSAVPFPLSLVVPSGPSTITTIIGPAGFLLLLVLRPDRDPWRWAGIVAAVCVLIGSILLAPPTSRSFLEPYFWLLMVIALQADQTMMSSRWLTWPIAMQAALTCGMFCFGAVTLFPGGVTSAWRSRIMERSANGYLAMKWSDSVLPRDAVMITPMRSMALAPRDAVSLDWTTAVNVRSLDAALYLRRLKDRGVTHILAFGSSPGFGGLDGCVGPLVAGPGDSVVAFRNPFSGGAHFPVWVYSFNSQLLPHCATGY